MLLLVVPFYLGSVFLLQIFSKLEEGRFPGEIELRDAIGRKLVNSGITGDGALWT